MREEKNGIREKMFTNFVFETRPVENWFQVWGKGLSPAKQIWWKRERRVETIKKQTILNDQYFLLNDQYFFINIPVHFDQ